MAHASHRNFYLLAADVDDRTGWIDAMRPSTEGRIDLESSLSVTSANRAAMGYLVKERPELCDQPWGFANPPLMYPMLEGVLQKQGSGFPWSWQERQFVLQLMASSPSEAPGSLIV